MIVSLWGGESSCLEARRNRARSQGMEQSGGGLAGIISGSREGPAVGRVRDHVGCCLSAITWGSTSSRGHSGKPACVEMGSATEQCSRRGRRRQAEQECRPRGQTCLRRCL